MESFAGRVTLRREMTIYGQWTCMLTVIMIDMGFTLGFFPYKHKILKGMPTHHCTSNHMNTTSVFKVYIINLFAVKCINIILLSSVQFRSGHSMELGALELVDRRTCFR